MHSIIESLRDEVQRLCRQCAAEMLEIAGDERRGG